MDNVHWDLIYYYEIICSFWFLVCEAAIIFQIWQYEAIFPTGINIFFSREWIQNYIWI